MVVALLCTFQGRACFLLLCSDGLALEPNLCAGDATPQELQPKAQAWEDVTEELKFAVANPTYNMSVVHSEKDSRYWEPVLAAATQWRVQNLKGYCAVLTEMELDIEKHKTNDQTDKRTALVCMFITLYCCHDC